MKNPVILVHGFYDTGARMKHIATTLQHVGRTVFSVSLKPRSAHPGIEHLAEQLKHFIQDTIAPDQKIDLIGFSMGGLVSRYYLQRLGGLDKVHHFISISTPHHGTRTASLYVWKNKAARQMRYKSDFITDLNKDLDKLKAIRFSSMWTPFDLMIQPAASSHIGFGKEVKIKALIHSLMVSNKKCIHEIEQALLR